MLPIVAQKIGRAPKDITRACHAPAGHSAEASRNDKRRNASVDKAKEKINDYAHPINVQYQWREGISWLKW